MPYQVSHWTICDGWVNCSTDGEGKPVVFSTRKKAQEDIEDYLADIQAQIDCGERAKDEGYDESEFCVEECK